MPKGGVLISQLARKATAAGFTLSRGTFGGGWSSLAIACGYDGHPNRTAAKAFLTKLLRDVELPARARKKRAPRVAATLAPVVGDGVVLADGVDVVGDEFLRTFAWRKLRMQAIKRYGRVCMCCGATPGTRAVINVDHIKPRRLFPQLALDPENLQILCHDCNHGKGNWDQTDWRPLSAR
jgi:hypothetical protein